MIKEAIKEERSEIVSIWVAPSLKREFELAKDNQTLKESIIRNYLQGEREWLEGELKQIDESTVKYSAKLIGIKDAFEKAQTSYVDEIQSIYDLANQTFKKIDTISNSTNDSIKRAKDNLSGMLTQIGSIDFYKIEKMIDLVNTVNRMDKSDLELLKKLLSV